MNNDRVDIEVTSSGRVYRKPGINPRTPFPHQIEAMRSLSLLNQSFDSYSTLVVLPTGGGKTYTVTNWLLKNAIDRHVKVLWIAHRHMLLDQAAQSFQKFSYPENLPNVSSYTYRIVSGSSDHDRTIDISPDDNVLIASKDSLVKKLDKLDEWAAGSDELFLVIDEAHHSTAKSYRKVIDHLREIVPNLKLIGITATPFRTAQSEKGLLGKIYYDGIIDGLPVQGEGGIAYEISLKELINKQILSRPIFEDCDTDEKFGSNLGGDDWERILNFDTLPSDIQVKMAKSARRNKLIVNRYLNHKQKYGPTLVFALNKIHAIQLNAQFEKAGVKSGFVVSDVHDAGTGAKISQEENARTIEKFANGDIDVLINVNILTEGVDLPQTKTVFLTRPTISKVLMTQMIGRGLRGTAAGGTSESYIVSFLDRWNEYIAWVNPETLLSEEGEFDDSEKERVRRLVRYIAISKVEEFARILDESIDTTLIESIPFIDRIPIGMYAFSYSEPSKDGGSEKVDRSYQIMVYKSTQHAYERFMDALPSLFDEFGVDDEYLSERMLYGMTESCLFDFFHYGMLPPYDRRDIVHALKYFAKEGVAPSFYSFEEVDRAKLDLSRIAQEIIDKDMRASEEKRFIDALWDEGDEDLFKIFFVHKQYFTRLLDIERSKLQNPELYELTPPEDLNVAHETRELDDLPLMQIRDVDPQYERQLRDEVFENALNEEGLYECAICGFARANRRPFQVDHIIPMNAGGKSVIENLQLLCRNCNAEKGEDLDD